MDRQELIRKINRLRSDEKLSAKVKTRIKQFEEIHEKDSKTWFNELCFCLLTANSSAKKGMEIQGYMKRNDGFMKLPKDKLTENLKRLGHRYYNKRSEFIMEARRFSDIIKDIITSFDNEFKAREWLVKNVKGLGYKEASHFLRNVGYKNLAILDKHILRLLHEHGMIQEIPKQLTRRRYYSIEKEIHDIGKELNIPLAELDLFMWYMKTGEVLK